MTNIEFGELRLNESSKKLAIECIESNWLSMGKYVAQLEMEWGKLFDYKYVRAVNSGTAADQVACMSLHALGARDGDEVICPALSFIASAQSIRLANLKPVFVDVKNDLNINVELIEDAITKRTKAIMAVNLMGRPADLDIIQEIAKRHSLYVIVDGCESYSCKYKGKFALEYAHWETASVFVAHLISAGTEGGMLSTNIPELARLASAIRNHGRFDNNPYFDHKVFSTNAKQTDIHAALLLGELPNLWFSRKVRKDNLTVLQKTMSEFEDLAYFTPPDDNDHDTSPHGFNITMKHAGGIELLKTALDAAGIHRKRTFGSQPTQHSCMSYLNYELGDFPVAEWIGDNSLHIGVHQFLTKEDLDRIVNCLISCFKGI